MKKVNIHIPDDLTPAEEASYIAKALSRKALGGTKQKLIGTGYDIKDTKTQIIIERVSPEPVVVLKPCSVCNVEFDIKKGTKLYTNYGGSVRELIVCSKTCGETMIDLVGPRVTFKKKEMKRFAFYQ